METVGEKEPLLIKAIAKQKLAYTGHVLRGSSGTNALIILEGKLEGKKAKGRPRRMWMDDVKDWTGMTNYSEIKRYAEDREQWRKLACLPSNSEDDT